MNVQLYNVPISGDPGANVDDSTPMAPTGQGEGLKRKGHRKAQHSNLF